MPRRKQTSCRQCRAKHVKCDGADPCANCAATQQQCTKPPKHMFRHEEGANVGITRHKTTFAFAYEPNQVWVTKCIKVDFVDASTNGDPSISSRGNEIQSETHTPKTVQIQHNWPNQDIDGVHSKILKSKNEAATSFQFTDLFGSPLGTPIVSEPPSPLDDLILQPGAIKEGLHSAYYRLHPGEADGGLQYFIHAAGSSPAMGLVLEAAALLYLGTKHKILDLKRSAQEKYVMALGKFRREIQSRSTTPATILGIIHIMETCELFSNTSSARLVGWQHHAFGNVSVIHEVLQSAKEDETWKALNGPLSSDTRVPFSLWHGLAQRRRLRAHEKFWTRAKDHDNILRVAITVPGVLELADRALETSADDLSHAILESLTELTALQGQLHRSLRKWCSKRNHLPYTLAPAESFATSLLHYEDINALPTSYQFFDIGAAVTYLTYWLCLLLTQISRLDAAGALAGLDSLTDIEIQKRVDEAEEYAGNICRSLAYCTLAEHGFVGRINIIGPLAFLREWYLRQDDEMRVEWCEKIAIRLQGAGLESPFATFAKTPENSGHL